MWLCIACLHAGAQPAPHTPHLVVILADALQFDDIENPECAVLKELAYRGSIGMMNCAVKGKKSGVTANLTLAAGAQVAAEASDSFAFNDWEAVPGENGEARMAYMRRVGPLTSNLSLMSPNPDSEVKHLGIAVLATRQLDVNRLGSALAAQNPPVTTWVGGNADTYSPDRSAAMLTVNSLGVGAGLVSLLRFDNSAPFGLIDDPLAMVQAAAEALERFDFVVLQTGDLSRLESARPYLSDREFHARRAAALRRLSILVGGLSSSADAVAADLLIVSPRPIANPEHPGVWDRLTPMIATGPDFPPGRLTSPTTRRIGLVANIDFAPTVLRHFHIQPPITMTGRAMQVVPTHPETDGKAADSGRLADIGRLAFVSALNEQAKERMLLPLGCVCFLIVSAALLVRRRGPASSRYFAPGLVFILNLPAAMLLAPLLVPPTLLEYGLRTAAWSVLLTGLCYLRTRQASPLRASPAVRAMALTVLLLAVDTMTGQTLQKDSVFCLYAVAGIRFYGIGNEYLGVLLAFSILSIFCLLDDTAGPARSTTQGNSAARYAAMAWIGIALICGWPGFGANAGSLTVTAAAFGVGLAILYGRKPAWGTAAASILLGLLLAFAFGALDSRLNGSESSHSGAAIQAAAGGRGAGYLADIAVRKILFNIHLLTSPGFLAGMAAIVVTLWIANALTGKALRQVMVRRVWLARSLYPLAAAATAALLFKDSGVVTVDFMAGSVTVVVLYYVISDAPPQN